MEFVGYTVGELVGVANIIRAYDDNYVIAFFYALNSDIFMYEFKYVKIFSLDLNEFFLE